MSKNNSIKPFGNKINQNYKENKNNKNNQKTSYDFQGFQTEPSESEKNVQEFNTLSGLHTSKKKIREEEIELKKSFKESEIIRKMLDKGADDWTEKIYRKYKDKRNLIKNPKLDLELKQIEDNIEKLFKEPKYKDVVKKDVMEFFKENWIKKRRKVWHYLKFDWNFKLESRKNKKIIWKYDRTCIQSNLIEEIRERENFKSGESSRLIWDLYVEVKDWEHKIYLRFGYKKPKYEDDQLDLELKRIEDNIKTLIEDPKNKKDEKILKRFWIFHYRIMWYELKFTRDLEFKDEEYKAIIAEVDNFYNNHSYTDLDRDIRTPNEKIYQRRQQELKNMEDLDPSLINIDNRKDASQNLKLNKTLDLDKKVVKIDDSMINYSTIKDKYEFATHMIHDPEFNSLKELNFLSFKKRYKATKYLEKILKLEVNITNLNEVEIRNRHLNKIFKEYINQLAKSREPMVDFLEYIQDYKSTVISMSWFKRRSLTGLSFLYRHSHFEIYTKFRLKLLDFFLYRGKLHSSFQKLLFQIVNSDHIIKTNKVESIRDKFIFSSTFPEDINISSARGKRNLLRDEKEFDNSSSKRWFNSYYRSEQLLVEGFKQNWCSEIFEKDTGKSKLYSNIEVQTDFLITLKPTKINLLSSEDDRIILTCWLYTRENKSDVFADWNFRNFLVENVDNSQSEPISIEMLDRKFPFPIDPTIKDSWSTIFQKFYNILKHLEGKETSSSILEFPNLNTGINFQDIFNENKDLSFLNNDYFPPQLDKFNIQIDNLGIKLQSEYNIDLKSILKIERINHYSIDTTDIDFDWLREITLSLDQEEYNRNFTLNHKFLFNTPRTKEGELLQFIIKFINWDNVGLMPILKSWDFSKNLLYILKEIEMITDLDIIHKKSKEMSFPFLLDDTGSFLINKL